MKPTSHPEAASRVAIPAPIPTVLPTPVISATGRALCSKLIRRWSPSGRVRGNAFNRLSSNHGEGE
ncbi:hypothetical protein GCM10023096_77890 [Nonomuraea ferruginea]